MFSGFFGIFRVFFLNFQDFSNKLIKDNEINERFEFCTIKSEIFNVAGSFLAEVVLDLLQVRDGLAKPRIGAPQSRRPQALLNEINYNSIQIIRLPRNILIIAIFRNFIGIFHAVSPQIS